MSLINDALKRAKTAHQQAPPSASIGPQLKPVEPQTPAHPAAGPMMPIAFAVVALLAVGLVWGLYKSRSAADLTSVRAQSSPAQDASAQATPLSEKDTPTPTTASRSPIPPSVPATVSNAVLNPAAEKQSIPAIAKTPVPVDNQANLASASDTNRDIAAASAGTNTSGNIPSASTNLGSSQLASASPPPLKLQGVVFDPKRPSAVISGRTLFVGDRIRQMRVTAITADTAILVGAGRTNVLTMAE